MNLPVPYTPTSRPQRRAYEEQQGALAIERAKAMNQIQVQALQARAAYAEAAFRINGGFTLGEDVLDRIPKTYAKVQRAIALTQSEQVAEAANLIFESIITGAAKTVHGFTHG